MSRAGELVHTFAWGRGRQLAWRMAGYGLLLVPWLAVLHGDMGRILQAAAPWFAFIVLYFSAFGVVTAARRIVHLEDGLRQPPTLPEACPVAATAWDCAIATGQAMRWRLFWFAVACIPMMLARTGRLGEMVESLSASLVFFFGYFEAVGLVSAACRIVTLEAEARGRASLATRPEPATAACP